MRYSLVNESDTMCLAAVGSSGLRTGSGLSLILDLAAQQRLRSLPHAHLSAGGKSGRKKPVRSSVRLSHLPIPGLLISPGMPRIEATPADTERSGLAFWDRGCRLGEASSGILNR